MSLRANVDRDRMCQFFEALGREFHGSARIYLVGGTTLVYEELRQQTLDIDLVIEVDAKEHGALIHAIRVLKDRLSVNVEEASPADFIPLPAGVDGRHRFIQRFGGIDIYHFDPYSSSLSKIERGRTQDLEDVLALLRARYISWEELARAFNEILPRVGTESLKQDPDEFAANFQVVAKMWRSERSESVE